MAEVAESRLFDNRTPESVLEEAGELGPFVARFCLFSGGNDSLVTAHRCRDRYDELVFIDTGTALPGVDEFVGEAAEWLGKPLRIMRQDFDAYRLLVLGGKDWKGDAWEGLGFPGPAQHGRCYNRLKERSLEALLREAKQGHPRSARVLAITGLRRAESARRRFRNPVNRKHAMVFANPLIDWSNDDLRRYRERHELPESDIAAIAHRSGECNCGSYAAPGEREMLRSLWPEWWEERIAPLEREAAERGLEPCVWGSGGPEVEDEAGELCSDCQLRLEANA